MTVSRNWIDRAGAAAFLVAAVYHLAAVVMPTFGASTASPGRISRAILEFGSYRR